MITRVPKKGFGGPCGDDELESPCLFCCEAEVEVDADVGAVVGVGVGPLPFPFPVPFYNQQNLINHTHAHERGILPLLPSLLPELLLAVLLIHYRRTTTERGSGLHCRYHPGA